MICNLIGAITIDHTQNHLLSDHYTIIRSLIIDNGCVYKINTIYNIVADRALIGWNRLFSCNFSTNRQNSDQQYLKIISCHILQSFRSVNDRVELSGGSGCGAVAAEETDCNSIRVRDCGEMRMHRRGLDAADGGRMKGKLKCRKAPLVDSFYLLKQLMYCLMMFNCLAHAIGANASQVGAYDMVSTNHTVRSSESGPPGSLPLMITNRTDADVLPLNYKSRKNTRSAGPTESLIELKNLRHYASGDGVAEHHHGGHHHADKPRQRHQKTQHTSESPVQMEGGFDLLSPNGSEDSSDEYSGCTSCQFREQLKAQNLESIRMNILARLSMSQPPNITTRPPISEHLIQSFYSQNGVRYIRVNGNSPADSNQDMGEMQGDDPMASDSTISHHFHYHRPAEEQMSNRMHHHHRDHRHRALNEKISRRISEPIESISHKYHPENEYEFDYGDPGNVYSTDFYDESEEFEEEAEEGFYSFTDSIYSFPKRKCSPTANPAFRKNPIFAFISSIRIDRDRCILLVRKNNNPGRRFISSMKFVEH